MLKLLSAGVAVGILVGAAGMQSTDADKPAAQPPAAPKPAGNPATGASATGASAAPGAELPPSPTRTDGKTVEQARGELKAAFDAMKSYTCELVARQFLEMGNGDYLETVHSGPVDFQRQSDGTIFLRQEKQGYRFGTLKGKEQKASDRGLVVVDRTGYYSLSETDGQYYAKKATIIPSTFGDPEVVLTEMLKNADMKLLPDEKHEGADCYVFETMARRATPLQPAKVLHYFRKEGGMLVLRVGLTPSGSEMFRVECKNVKVNVDIKPERFKFELPPGVELHDATIKNAPLK